MATTNAGQAMPNTRQAVMTNTNQAVTNTDPVVTNTDPAANKTNPAATKGNPAGYISSNSNMASSVTSGSATFSPSLLGIGPKLRLAIYAHAFAAPPGPIDLTQAVAPSKALLLTCHQIRDEAAQLYRTAYRDFWEKSTFKVDVRGCCLETATEQVCMQDEEDLAHITKMHVLTGPGLWVWNGWSGLWTRWNDDYPYVRGIKRFEELWVPISMWYNALWLLRYLMPLLVCQQMNGVMAVHTMRMSPVTLACLRAIFGRIPLSRVQITTAMAEHCE